MEINSLNYNYFSGTDSNILWLKFLSTRKLQYTMPSMTIYFSNVTVYHLTVLTYYVLNTINNDEGFKEVNYFLKIILKLRHKKVPL